MAAAAAAAGGGGGGAATAEQSAAPVREGWLMVAVDHGVSHSRDVVWRRKYCILHPQQTVLIVLNHATHRDELPPPLTLPATPSPIVDVPLHALDVSWETPQPDQTHTAEAAGEKSRARDTPFVRTSFDLSGARIPRRKSKFMENVREVFTRSKTEHIPAYTDLSHTGTWYRQHYFVDLAGAVVRRLHQSIHCIEEGLDDICEVQVGHLRFLLRFPDIHVCQLWESTMLESIIQLVGHPFPYHSLNIHIGLVDGLPSQDGLYLCEVHKNDILLCRTMAVQGAKTAIWNQGLDLTNIGALDCVDILLFSVEQPKRRDSNGSRVRLLPIATYKLSLQGTQDAGSQDRAKMCADDTPSSPSTSASSSPQRGTDNCPTLNLKWAYVRIPLLRVNTLEPLFTQWELDAELLCDELLKIDGTGSLQKELYMHVINLFAARRKIIDFAKRLYVVDLRRSKGSAETAYRSDTPITKVLSAYVTTVCKPYIHRALSRFMAELLAFSASHPAMEIDPAKCGNSSKTQQQNCANLLRFSKDLWTCIFESRDAIPNELKVLFHELKVTAEQEGASPSSFSHLLSSVFLHRFVSAYLTRISETGGMKVNGCGSARRNVVLVCKFMSALGNRIRHTGYLSALNELVESEAASCDQFFVDICNGSSSQITEMPGRAVVESKSLSCIFHLLVQNRKTMEDPEKYPAMTRLFAVVDRIVAGDDELQELVLLAQKPPADPQLLQQASSSSSTSPSSSPPKGSPFQLQLQAAPLREWPVFPKMQSSVFGLTYESDPSGSSPDTGSSRACSPPSASTANLAAASTSTSTSVAAAAVAAAARASTVSSNSSESTAAAIEEYGSLSTMATLVLAGATPAEAADTDNPSLSPVAMVSTSATQIGGRSASRSGLGRRVTGTGTGTGGGDELEAERALVAERDAHAETQAQLRAAQTRIRELEALLRSSASVREVEM
eukprot:m.195536 g.195536  ORF g.195536 m.195536 type:complete len:952 (-) comp17638_c0_seq4:1451-4306(-)